MALKPRHKRRIFWSIIGLIGAIVLSVIIVPPMITLNSFKPMVEKSIVEQTNVNAKLNGDIHFSLIGGATIVAHDVEIPNAHIGSIMFSIPFHSIFNIQNAKLNDAVVIYDADITIDKLAAVMFNHNIEIYNSTINFLGRQYHIIRADFTNGEFHGVIRTNHHKYDIEFIGDTFHIKNRNNNLDIIGQIYTDGSTRGQMSLDTDNVNDWFGFTEPKINQPVHLTTNFSWDGGHGYKFTDIVADNFSGNIDRNPDGSTVIQLVSDNANIDFSFLFNKTRPSISTTYNLDLYGKINLGKYQFNHFKLQATGTGNKYQITNVIADDITITGGTITADGAENILITMPIDGIPTMCLFSGSTTDWQCSKFSYGDMSGSLSVSDGVYKIVVKSDVPFPTDNQINNLIKSLGTNGTIDFTFSDIGGTYIINDKNHTASYKFAKNKTLKWLKPDLPFIPKFMLSDTGDFSWDNGMMTFVPYNKQWQLSVYDNYFYLTGTSFKRWLPNIDLQSINDAPYSVSGFYQDGKISNLVIKISGHEFFGNASHNNLTLHTNVLSVDTFTNSAFFDNFAEQEFLSNAPLLIPFNLPVNISLSANTLIYDNNEYRNFVYALKTDSQTFSISDSARGNLLVTIERDKTKYDIFAQLNRFVINGKLLSDIMPLNIRDTTITAEIALTTFGQIAHDIYYNMTGNLDLSFEGGYFIGMSFDKFFASAENITTLNAEYALADALGNGETKLKRMHIVGTYDRDNFITTQPITLSMRHTDAIGGLAITNGQMTAEFDLTLRGTALKPATIQLSVLPNGGRKYSLTEIMQNIDVGYMRAFISTHDKF